MARSVSASVLRRRRDPVVKFGIVFQPSLYLRQQLIEISRGQVAVQQSIQYHHFGMAGIYLPAFRHCSLASISCCRCSSARCRCGYISWTPWLNRIGCRPPSLLAWPRKLADGDGISHPIFPAGDAPAGFPEPCPRFPDPPWPDGDRETLFSTLAYPRIGFILEERNPTSL